MKVEKQQSRGQEGWRGGSGKSSGYASWRSDVGSKYPHQLTHNCLDLQSWKIWCSPLASMGTPSYPCAGHSLRHRHIVNINMRGKTLSIPGQDKGDNIFTETQTPRRHLRNDSSSCCGIQRERVQEYGFVRCCFRPHCLKERFLYSTSRW